ncbi:hypothetical protein GCM10009785_32060 [Brooklawnia cerclae]|uniref:Helix-turn-helix domain-containing protein n=1 Tax=Brooklawnia cerclae TaxID=349934 RepID=A0ABX0SDN1_9ACTN|nr:hypothetical protein [Brooklawnia cerclae]NIH56502.1 hypothetical protein [Brooklawnia cerclae]
MDETIAQLHGQSPDIGEGLRAAVALRHLADSLEAREVARARASGWSWQLIATHLDVTKQAVHKKYAHIDR